MCMKYPIEVPLCVAVSFWATTGHDNTTWAGQTQFSDTLRFKIKYMSLILFSSAIPVNKNTPVVDADCADYSNNQLSPNLLGILK